MEAYLLDWLSLLLRWGHVVFAIAWIGSSFYFVFLDNSLTPPSDPALRAKGVDGELWAVHGGGFYHPQKYLVAPKQLPENLHWFYWEGYATWLSGMGLFVVVYLFNASVFLIDKRVLDWSPAGAIVCALAFLAVFWFVYDLICRNFGRRKHGDAIVALAVSICVLFACWLAGQLFAGRAAFLLVGAMLATAMSANVFVWIIPGQRTVIAQMRAGQPVDPIHGARGKQRSVHNTYFTLPVLVAMLSNHYGWLYQGRNNWLVLAVLMLAAALIRHSFVARHKAKVQARRVPWEYAIGGVVLIAGLVAALAPPLSNKTATEQRPNAAGLVDFAAVAPIIEQRCVLCHNKDNAQKNVALHSAALIKQHAQSIYQQVVVLRLMPMNNATQITDAERKQIKQWFEAGANTQ